MKRYIRPWRINYVIEYKNRFAAEQHRAYIHDVLQSLSRLKKIECKIISEHTFVETQPHDNGIDLYKQPADLVYLRSSKLVESSPKEFRELIALVFGKPQVIGSYGAPDFSIAPQRLSSLDIFPFPED